MRTSGRATLLSGVFALLVGCTVDLKARLREGHRNGMWWRLCGEITTQTFPDRTSALFAEAQGLAVIREIAVGAPAHMRPRGLLALEVAPTQAEAVADALRAAGYFEDVQVVRDLAGRDRIVTAVRKAD